MVSRCLCTNVSRRNVNILKCLERPLVMAASLGRREWMEALLMAGANPSETDGRGRNAFFAAFDNRDMTKHWFIIKKILFHLCYPNPIPNLV